jgi:hypothetical protein
VIVIKGMAERVGFEFARKRSFNNIEGTAGNVKQWKAAATDHKRITASDHFKAPTKAAGTLMFP